MALLTALLLAAIAVTPVLADSSEPPPTNGSVISPVPEPGTLLFVGIAGTALFIRRRERCLR